MCPACLTNLVLIAAGGIIQSLEQLKAVYKDDWETFLANSGLDRFQIEELESE